MDKETPGMTPERYASLRGLNPMDMPTCFGERLGDLTKTDLKEMLSLSERVQEISERGISGEHITAAEYAVVEEYAQHEREKWEWAINSPAPEKPA